MVVAAFRTYWAIFPEVGLGFRDLFAREILILLSQFLDLLQFFGDGPIGSLYYDISVHVWRG